MSSLGSKAADLLRRNSSNGDLLALEYKQSQISKVVQVGGELFTDMLELDIDLDLRFWPELSLDKSPIFGVKDLKFESLKLKHLWCQEMDFTTLKTRALILV